MQYLGFRAAIFTAQEKINLKKSALHVIILPVLSNVWEKICIKRKSMSLWKAVLTKAQLNYNTWYCYCFARFCNTPTL